MHNAGAARCLLACFWAMRADANDDGTDDQVATHFLRRRRRRRHHMHVTRKCNAAAIATTTWSYVGVEVQAHTQAC